MNLNSGNNQFFLDSDDDTNEIPEVDPYRIAQMSLEIQKFKNQPIPLIQISSLTAPLKNVATHLNSILLQPGEIKYSVSSRKDLINILSAFVTEIYSIAKESSTQSKNEILEGEMAKKFDESQKKVQALNSENQLLQSRISELTAKNNEIQNENDSLKSQISETKDIINVCNDENQNLNDLVSKLHKENETTIKDLYKEKDFLDMENQKLSDQLKIEKYSNNRLMDQNNDLNEELNIYKKDSIGLKLKVTSKQARIQTLRDKLIQHENEKKLLETENHKIIAIVNEYKSRLISVQKVMEKNDQSQNIEKMEKYKRINEELSQQLLSQSNEINTLSNNLHCLSNILIRQNEVLGEYDKKLEQSMNQNRVLGHSSEEMNTKINTLRDVLESQRKKSVLLDHLENLLVIPEGMTLNDALALLIQNASSPDAIVQNKRLVSYALSLVEFINAMAHNKMLKLSLLISENDNEEISLNNIESALSRAKNNILKRSILDQEYPQIKEEILNELKKKESLIGKEAYLYLSSEMSKNIFLEQMINETLDKNEDLTNNMKNLSSLIGFTGEIKYIGSNMSKYIKNIQNRMNEISQIIGVKENDVSFQIKSTMEYCIQTSEFIKFFDNTIRKLIKYEGKVLDMPKHLLKVISEMRNELNSKNLSENEMYKAQQIEFGVLLDAEKRRFDEMKTIYDGSSAEKENIILTLRKKIDSLEASITKHKSDLIITEQKCSNLENRINNMTTHFKSIEMELERSKSETICYKEIAERTRNECEQSMSQLIEEETQNRESFKEKIEKRFLEERKELMDDIESKQKRIRKMKMKLKEIITVYETSYNQQKESYLLLKQQNDSLTQSIILNESELNPINTASQETLENLEKENIALKSEIMVLKSNLRNLNDRASLVYDARTENVTVQIAQLESEFNRKLKGVETALRNQHSDFLQKLSSMLEKAKFVVEVPISDNSILASLTRVLTKLDISQLNESKSQMSLSQSFERSIQSNTQNWDRWARNLYRSVEKDPKNSISIEGIKEFIENKVIYSIKQQMLYSRIDSLCTQKLILMNNHPISEQKGTLNLKSLIGTISFCTMLLRK